MHNPVVALLWESWRLSRRWYLWVLAVAIGVHLFGMEQAHTMIERLPPGVAIPDLSTAYLVVARVAFLMGLALAFFTTLLAVTHGNKAGFPLSFAFRLPINTPVLVAVPMAFLALLCASLYFVPALLGRLLYGVPFPVLPVSMVLATLVIALLASSWTMSSMPTRTGAMIAAFAAFLQLFRWLEPMQPFNVTRGQLHLFTREVFVLAPMEYVALVALCLLLYGFTLASIRGQRCGEESMSWLKKFRRARQQDGGERSGASQASSSGTLQDRVADLFAIACPVQAPWRAELWLELKRTALPIVLFSLMLALVVPVLLALGVSSFDDLGRLDYVFPLAVLLTGMGYAIFNRRLQTAGYMSAFEGTRGMSTVKLALIQLLAVGASCLCGILLVCLSLYLSWPLFEEGELGRQLQALPAALTERSVLRLLGETIAVLAFYLGSVALFACVHVCFVIWSRLFPYGMGLLALYLLFFSFSITRGTADLENIKQHMWGFAMAVLLLTLLSLAKVLHLRLFSARSGLAVLLCWGVFVACGLYSLAGRGIELPEQAPELQAFNAALLLLPLTLFVLLVWAYDRLRHR